MASSYVKYVGDGSTTGPYSVPFPYLNKTHVAVTVSGVEVSFTWTTSSTITLTTAAILNAVIFIKRVTQRDERLVDYQNGSFLNEETLDTDSLQAFYLVQEAYDWITLNQDEDGLVFHDRDSILDSINGYLDESVLTEHLQSDLSQLVDRYIDDEALFESDQDVLEDGIVSTPLGLITFHQLDVPRMDGRLTTAEIDINAAEAAITLKAAQLEVDGMETRLSVAEVDIDGAEAQITLNVAEIVTNGDDITYNAGQVSLLADEFMVKLDANGYVAGFGLYNNGTVSEFTVNVDKFAIIKADGTGSIQKPFTVDSVTGLVAIEGSLIVTGSIDTDQLAANAITAAKIAAGTITADEIAAGTITATEINTGTITADRMNISSLSTIAANIGTITSGIIRSNNWGSAVGSEFALDDGQLTIRSAAGIKVEQGGDITIDGQLGDAGKLLFKQNGTVALEIDPVTTSLTQFKPGSDGVSRLTFGTTSLRYDDIAFYTDNKFSFECYRSSTNNARVWVDVDNDGGELGVRVEENGYSHDYMFYYGQFRPGNDMTTNLGSSSFSWDIVYATEFNVQSDLLWMDERKDKEGNLVPVDDIKVIRDIKPSNQFNPVTGLRIVNDSTIPTWLAAKHKKDSHDRNEDGDIIRRYKKGDTAYNTAGKPYVSLTTMISLLMGAVRKLDSRLERIESNGRN